MKETLKKFTFSLLWLAPFIAFLRSNAYPFVKPEVFVLMLCLVTTGFLFNRWYEKKSLTGKMVLSAIAITIALSFFATWSTMGALLIGFFAALMLGMFFTDKFKELIFYTNAVFLVSVVMLPMPVQAAKPTNTKNTTQTARGNLSAIIYIILDEQGGIDAIPTNTNRGKNLKSSLENFYINRGFHVYNRAYSHYANTYNSIPNLLNFTASNQDNFYFHTLVNRHLEQNQLFDLLAKKGYQFKIYEGGDYLDYCAQKNIPIAACYSFPTASAGMAAYGISSFSDRLVFLTKSFLLQSLLYHAVADVYEYFLLMIPDKTWDEARVSSLSMLPTFEQLRHDVGQASNGTVFFAHIFAPHAPYSYDADCQLKPMADWREGGDQGMGDKNTPDSREQAYAAYEEQTGCVQKQMGFLLDEMKKLGIYDQAIIIVHGDHGSRIALHKPFVENKSILTAQDFQDYYLTFYAVKFPGQHGLYNDRVEDLQTLLAHAVYRITGQFVPVPATPPFIYLLPNAVGLPLEKVFL